MDIYSSKLSSAVDYGIGAFLLLIAILSILGNLMVLVMAYKRSNHMKPPELLSVNLAVTDLGAAVTMYPLAVASAWNHHWIGGDVSCVYYGLMGFLFGAASMMTLTIMAIVRFIVSLTLQSPKEKISKRNAKILVATTWLYALLWAIFPLIGWGKYGPEPFGLSCTLDWRDMKEHSQSFVITIFLMNLILPAIIIVSCYCGIALRLYVTYKSMDDSNHVPNMIKMQRRLMVIAVLISIGFVGCWAPYGIVSLWSIYRPGDSIPAEVSMLPCLFAKTSTVYNPFIYYIFSKTFKREVNQLSRFCGRSNICRPTDAKNRPENTIYLVCDVNKSKPGVEDLSLARSKENETQMLPNQDLHE
ncbi:opsin 8, group member b [Danio rerio]|uniref:Novopsin-8 n=1 Tax=Danio rerio TaxID=7955 RepID=F1QCL1_DANRE|nr:opsin 8, group member b [Danio rerio]ALG92562.1 novopsin-8 [Danio rerio]|eukprot:NP_001303874.1 opsin 8, group member b [Danio rerio]